MSSAYIVTPNLTAQGNITPSTFVQLDANNDFSVVQATAGGRTFGISQPGTKYPPGTPGDSGLAFQAGDAATIYGPGAVCLLLIGSGGCTRGNFLKSDANGNGIVSSTTGDAVGAIALESGNYGEYRKVFVTLFNHA